MTREDVERLVRVELGLQEVQKDLGAHQKLSEQRSEELKSMILSLGVKIDAQTFKWSSLLNQNLIKVVGYVILSLAGLAGAAKALL